MTYIDRALCYGWVLTVLIASGCDDQRSTPVEDATINDGEAPEQDGDAPDMDGDAPETDGDVSDAEEPDAGDDAAARPYCRWEDKCDGFGNCTQGWVCGCGWVEDERCLFERYATCKMNEQCAADEFCSERHTCGTRCNAVDGCVGKPCLGDESCAEDEYCSDAETCAARCANPEGCLGQACAGDESCAADEYCSTAEHCSPRCTDELGCAGPELRRGRDDRPQYGPSWPVISDGHTVYYHRVYGSSSNSALHSTEEPKDVAYAWDLSSAPEIGSSWEGDIIQMRVRDGQLYVLSRHPTFGTTFWRGPPVSSLGEAIDYDVESFWFSEEAVWWSKHPNFSYSSSELWRSPRVGALAPGRVAKADHRGWSTGNASVVFRIQDPGSDLALIQDSLPDLTPSETIASYARARDYYGESRNLLLADGQSLFITLGEQGAQLVRIKLDGSGENIALAPPDVQTRGVFLKGDWVYWGAQLDADTATINRTHRDLLAPPQELVRGDLSAATFTVTDDALVHSDAKHFFVKPLPPLSCSTSLPCPDGGTCTAESVCE